MKDPRLPDRWLELLPYERESGSFFGILMGLAILTLIWIITRDAIRKLR